MKIFTFVFAFLMFSGMYSISNAQLMGSKTIPGDYPTIADAIAALNGQGVGTGGVTFNVISGHTEVSSNLVISIVNDPPSSSNPVVFQASFPNASGASNPLITAAPGSSATLDGIIKFSGTDYITFDGIDLLDPVSNTGDERMEWGYAFFRADSADGSQHNVIKNCNITLQKINTSSIGIYVINKDTTGATFAANNPLGLNSFNKFYGNNISNVYKGIHVISSSVNRDENNEVGVNGFDANNISNFGGSTITCEGIRCEGQINVKINNNIINGGAGTSGSAAVYGIIATLFGATATAPSYEISYNQVTVSASVTSQGTYAIRALATADKIYIHHNTVENCNVIQNTTTFSAIVHDPTGVTNEAYIHDNIVRNNSHSGTGTSTLLGQPSGTVTNLYIFSNQVYGNQKTGIGGTMNCIIAATASINCDSNSVYNNSMPNTSGTSASNVYGYVNTSSPVSETVFDNEIYNLTVGGSNTSNSSLVVGIRSNANAATIKDIYRNKIYSLNAVSGSSTTGGVFGIYSSLSNSAKIHSNQIYDITNTALNSLSGGIWVSSGSGIEIYNNFISEINAPNSTNANGVIGINITNTTANSTVGIYYNSVYLNAAGGSTFGSSGISVTSSATSTSGALTMMDNILINLSSPGSTSGVTTAFRRSSTNLGNFASSDYNDFYSGTPSANRLIFFDGTNSDQTLAQYQARVSPNDANSKSVAVNFVNAVTGDLHLTGASIGDIDLAGTPVSGITTDIDGTIRSATTPYKGADESTPFVFPTLNLTLNLEACSPMQDTVAVLIRNTTAPYAVIDSLTGYLSPSGTVSISYPNAANGVSYYIVVRHRNSIETWSKSGGEMFTANILNYDFTSSLSQAYDNNQVLVGSEYSIYTGDPNQDGIVDLSDLVLISNDASNFTTGYAVTDLNCNSIVDLTDLIFCQNNSSIFVSVKKP
jgi:hypothetical protein